MDIVESFPGAWAIVPQGQDQPRKEYWLYHGQAIPKTSDTPPWPPKASPWDKAEKSKPQVYYDQIDPDADGNATLWYRAREDAARRDPRKNRRAADPQGPKSGVGKRSDWRVSRPIPHRHQSTVAPARRPAVRHRRRLRRDVPLRSSNRPDHILGPRVGLAPYTTIVCGGKLYLSGYSGGHLFVFDPARHWTLGKGGPPGDPAPDQADPRSNPRYLGDFDRTTRVGLMHSSALGADGKTVLWRFRLAALHRRRVRLVRSRDRRRWTASGNRSAAMPSTGSLPR